MKRFICLTAILIGFPLAAQVEMVHSIKEVRELLRDADSDTLVVFDIDQTIIVPTTSSYQLPNVIRHKHLLVPFAQQWSIEKQEIAKNSIVIGSTVRIKLLEPEIATFISDLQNKDVPVIALTAGLNGPFGEVLNVPRFRQNQLRQLGIDITKTAPPHGFVQFDTLKCHIGAYPQAITGVISANGEKTMKGEVLSHYFSWLGWTPKKVVMIDDDPNQIGSFHEPMEEQRGIEYLGIYYKAIYEFDADGVDEKTFVDDWNILGKKADFILKQKNL